MVILIVMSENMYNAHNIILWEREHNDVDIQV